MNIKSELGKCLSELLCILNISGSNLSKAINVDPSVISRWKTGKRIIPANSNYLELISNYLSDNISTTLQEDKIKNIAVKYNIPINNGNILNMSEYIYNILITAQNSSTIKLNKNKHTYNNSIFHPNKNMDITNNELSSTLIDQIYDDSSSNISSFKIEDTLNNLGLVNDSEIILGEKKIFKTGIELLKLAIDTPCCSNESIFITSFSEFDFSSKYKVYSQEWKKVLLKVLNCGWDVQELILLNDNMNRNLKIINEFKMYLLTGKYHPYYTKKYVPLLCSVDFLLVPSIGALVILGNHSAHNLNIAFLIKNGDAIEVLKGLLNQFFDNSLPLLQKYSSKERMDFQLAVTRCEEKPGDKYTCKNDLSNLTIPLDIYKEYLYRLKISEDEISKRMSNHKRRLNAFVSHIKDYKYYDICSKRCIEKLIKNGGYHLYINSSNKYSTAKPLHILSHLKNVVYMLEKYDNYNIALLEEIQIDNLSNVMYMIKDYDSVFIQIKDHCENVLIDGDSDDEKYINKIYFSISEPTIVNTFKNDFFNLWNEIAPINKDKESVISWFKTQIKSLSLL